MTTKLSINQRVPMPQRKRPIYVIGAGGIVKDAHLPAYRLAGFDVAGIVDLDRARAEQLAKAFDIPQVYGSLGEMVKAATADAVYDVAIPASATAAVLEQLPRDSAVLIQKPLGDDLTQARTLLEICTQRHLTAAVNFQLRFAPYILAARSLIEQGVIGELHDMEVRVTVHMPWHLWQFMNDLPRVEILYHSIHYIDLIRSFLGNPHSVYAKTVKHPRTAHLASTRSNIILDYGDLFRANITTNHGHDYGLAHQESYVKWEGTRGAIKARLGLLMNYPIGEPDLLQYCTADESGPSAWHTVPVEGSWFPHAFIGSMASLMRNANGETDDLPTSVADAYQTMAAVEAAYESSALGGIAPRYDPKAES